MGAVLSRYRFEKTPTIEQIADRFHALTGLDLIATAFGGHSWELSAWPLRDSAELSRGGGGLHLTWFVGGLRGGYFVPAVKQTLQDLGGHMPSHRVRYPIRRWDELSVWQRWWRR